MVESIKNKLAQEFDQLKQEATEKRWSDARRASEYLKFCQRNRSAVKNAGTEAEQKEAYDVLMVAILDARLYQESPKP